MKHGKRKIASALTPYPSPKGRGEKRQLFMHGNEDHGNDELPLCCHRCGTELEPGKGNYFLVSIVAMADPFPPVFSKEDLLRDAKEEIRRLIEQMRDLSEREAMDQVYRRLVIYLCNPCYRQWIENPV